jgi:hypothetical protein
MNAAPPLAFPGGRVLAGWWKLLTPLHPRALWVGTLLLHHVEALVCVPQPARLDPLPLFALKALALAPGESLERLNDRLHLGSALLRQLVVQLEGERLIAAEEGGAWSLTAAGRAALANGEYLRDVDERRVFHFAEPEQSDRPPAFLRLRDRRAPEPWPASDNWHFDVAVLQDAVRRPAAWKERHGFPADVREVLLPAEGGPPFPEPPPWQRVVLDYPEYLTVVLVLVPAPVGGDQLLGFAVRREGWELEAGEPVFAQPDGAALIADLAVEPTADDWRQAWRAWCQPRGLPTAEVEACVLEPAGWRLRVLASGKLIDRLRSARSDALKGEAWLIAGTSRLRAAARLELVEGSRPIPTVGTSGSRS